MHVEIHEVDESRWPDLVTLMETRGGPSNCWCLVWREPSRVRSGLDLAGRRAAMKRRLRVGTPIGLLAYVDGAPVGWCSVAPRETYIRLGGRKEPEGTDVWSIVCFFVVRAQRANGLGETLLQEAIATAKRHGASVVEAYPVDPDSPSYRFMGFVPMFERAGFEEIGRVGKRRHVMQLCLDGA